MMTTRTYITTMVGIISLTAFGQTNFTWSPGVRGGIPHYTNIFNVKSAPYSAYGDGVHDDTLAISNALRAANGNVNSDNGGGDNFVSGNVVYLPAGTYLVNAGFSWSTSGLVFRGDGPNVTVLKCTNTSGTFLTIFHDSWWGGPFNITNGAILGSTNIWLDNASDVTSIGSFITNAFLWVAQTNPPFVSAYNEDYGAHGHPTNLMQQGCHVLSVSGNKITLERPLYFNYTLLPQAYLAVFTQYSGVEDLTVWNTNPTTLDNDHLVGIGQSANCWIKNVSITNAPRTGFKLDDAYACIIQDCIFWDAFAHNSGHGYALYCFDRNSDHLIINNIIYRARHSMIFEGGGCGVVYAYNYAFGTYQDEAPNWLSEDTDMHGGHPWFNLFEGNVTTKICGDYSHGSCGNNTFFREWVVNHSSQTVTNVNYPTEIARNCVDFQEFNYSNAVIGCVLGSPGDVGLRYQTNTTPNTTLCTYHWGGNSPGSISFDDTNVWPSMYLHGNYDYIGGGIVWNTNNADHVLPNSLFLTNAPSWWNSWGTTPWPPIGSDLTPMVSSIPAQLRYAGGTAPTNPTTVYPTTFHGTIHFN